MEEQQVKKLIDQCALPDSCDGAQLIETHISWLILADHYAFKIKKPHQLSFLDFSTLQKRKYYAYQELVLNRRLTQDIYLQVLPIKQQDDHLVIGAEEGTTIDYAVQMRKLDLDHQMHLLLQRDQVSNEDVQKIATIIGDFHQTTDVIFDGFDLQVLEQSFNDLASVKEVVTQYLNESTAEEIDQAIRWSNQFVEAHRGAFYQRKEQGMIRDCHGDLHSRNIFIYNAPVIFDCIEFNEAFRQIDVLNEVGFFTMDLEAHGKGDLAKAFMDTYLQKFPCINTAEEENLLTYYKAYRANVRAKVTALKVDQLEDEAERKSAVNNIKLYLDLMMQYLHSLGNH